MESQWSRSQGGVLAGVCKGLAKRFDLDVLLVRLMWLFSVLFFGTGLLAYIILALALPREDKLSESYESKILGVCGRFARRFHLDVGLTRIGFLLGFIFSGGAMFFFYLALYFILPKASELTSK